MSVRSESVGRFAFLFTQSSTNDKAQETEAREMQSTGTVKLPIAAIASPTRIAARFSVLARWQTAWTSSRLLP